MIPGGVYRGTDADFKVIYGVEAYLVDDMKEIVQNRKGSPCAEPLWCLILRQQDFPHQE